MSAQRKWVIGIVSIVVVFALLACGIFFGWRYLFPGKPSVVITAPPSNYQAPEGDEVTVEARATGRSIVRMELWVDDGLMDTASSPSPQDTFSAALTWQASGVGPHIVQAKAYTLAGKESDPAGITIIVVPVMAEATPTITVEPSETPTPTTTPTATPTSPPAATPTPTTPPPTATPTETPVPPTPTPTSPPPSCPATFTASPETQTQGSPFDLTWHVDNATALHLSGPAVGDHVPVTGPDGSMTVCCPPVGTHTYTLHVSCPAGDFDKQVTVTVIPPTPILDQFQTAVDYGFWLDDEARRWQEFKPTLSHVSSVQIYVRKEGNPGNLITEIRTVGDAVLGQKISSVSVVPSSGWLTVNFPAPIGVSPGTKYRIYVYADQDSPSPSQRYFWQGKVDSAYDSQCLTDVSSGWPNYDYAFKTFGY